MKFKYIFIMFIAVIGLFVSCNDEKELGSLTALQVSQSTLSIPQNGGEVSFEVTAASDWKFVTMTSGKKGVAVDSVPAWIKPSCMGGGAGTTTVTFKADAIKGANNSTFMVVSGAETQYITVIQGVLNPPFSTCAEVLAGPDAETYKVKGTMTKISNTTYGNWYINDGTGEVYVYGTLDANGGEKNFSSLKLEEGDEVTIQGPKSTYNGTVELVNVSVLSYTKSLVKVDSVSTSTLAKDGGEFKAYLTVKGDGVTVDIPEADQSWLSIKGIVTSGTSAEITFRANANAGGARTSTISFTSASGEQSSTVTSEFSQEGSIIECNIADFNAAEKGSTIYRITGVISQVANASYGNVYIKDASGETYVYGIGSKGDFEKKGLKVGDVVTLTGVKDEYKGVAQMKSATLEAFKPVTPVTVAEFLAKDDNDNVYYMLTGKVANIKSAQYGNYDLVDATGSVYIYGTLAGWGGASKQFESFGIGEGDEISVITIKTSYKGTAQGKNAILFSEKK